MKNLFLVILLSLTFSLSGCSLFCPKPEPGPATIVYVPTPVKCDAPNVNTPMEYPFDRATKDMTTFEKLRLALSEIEILKGYTKELEAVKDKCTADPKLTQIK